MEQEVRQQARGQEEDAAKEEVVDDEQKEKDERLRRVVLERLSEALSEVEPGAIVTRYAAVVEFLDKDGERYTWMLAPPDSRAQDSLGLLGYADAIERAGVVRAALQQDED